LDIEASTYRRRGAKMLGKKDNEVLSHVGRGTPLGGFMRRYWHPIALSSQVAQPDGDPLRVQLLGEHFVVFRDTAGRVGVLDEKCMHRGVSLSLGRNEQGGLRCLYHGWKFAVDGTILETPNHADCRLRQHLKAPAYPVREQSGIVWTYIGEAKSQPPFRSFAFDLVPDAHRTVFRANTKAHWLPLLEGGLDSSHVPILHTNLTRPTWRANTPAVAAEYNHMSTDLTPEYEVDDTAFGIQYCAFRKMPDGMRNARMVPAVLPNLRFIPIKGRDLCVIEVPLNDRETSTYIVVYNEERPLDREEEKRFQGLDSALYDEISCNIRMDSADGFGQDRRSMSTNWTGFSGVEIEDFAVSTSIGSDWDRTREHLVPSDVGVVRFRRRILDAVAHFQEGQQPPGVDLADMTGVVGYERNLSTKDIWQDFVPAISRASA
jgi:phthalate 4,5-dioxygenase